MRGVGDLKPNLKSESGQALLEFFLTLMLFLTLSFFFIQTSLVFGWSNYIQYATYMSARAYFAAGSDPGEQKQRAESVLHQMVKRNGGGEERFPMLAREISSVKGGAWPGYFNPTDRDLSWAEGVRYKFRSRLFVIPLPGFDGKVELTSDTWLGRETTHLECDSAMSGKRWIYDNGC